MCSRVGAQPSDEADLFTAGLRPLFRSSLIASVERLLSGQRDRLFLAGKRPLEFDPFQPFGPSVGTSVFRLQISPEPA